MKNSRYDRTIKLLENKKTPVFVLWFFLNSKEVFYLDAILCNPKATEKMISRIYKRAGMFDFIRLSVSLAPNTPLKVLRELAVDPIEEIRRNAFNHPNIYLYMIQELLVWNEEIERRN